MTDAGKLLAPSEQDHSVLRMFVEICVDTSGVPSNSIINLSERTIFLLKHG